MAASTSKRPRGDRVVVENAPLITFSETKETVEALVNHQSGIKGPFKPPVSAGNKFCSFGTAVGMCNLVKETLILRHDGATKRLRDQLETVTKEDEADIHESAELCQFRDGRGVQRENERKARAEKLKADL